MTIAQLNKYRRNAAEIRDIEQELDSNHYVADTVSVCTPPSYTPHSKRIDGYLPSGNTLSLLSRLGVLRAEQRACEEYIRGIEDWQTRKIFELHFIKGKTYLQTAIACGLGHKMDCVKKRIYRYVENN